jgi:hypothetical protein
MKLFFLTCAFLFSTLAVASDSTSIDWARADAEIANSIARAERDLQPVIDSFVRTMNNDLSVITGDIYKMSDDEIRLRIQQDYEESQYLQRSRP